MLAPLAQAHATAPTPERMREAAQRFEAQVFAQLLQPAFESLGQGGFGGGAAEAQWRPMLVEGFAAAAARAGRGIGLQNMVLRHMIRLQELSSSNQENRP
ncbi:rod-binding protein [Roseococcus pinisoli]|uniref:Rod-binding protein n=1 Tax=Roseococcus pinisoli TaxID=2835040 RepID=A0ABS5QBM3_9PROT|nr:rod-binding protein [Roseococcus pinisoli]MBS7811096.1 rod-binding protein [Roseococcus pinisoli]